MFPISIIMHYQGLDRQFLDSCLLTSQIIQVIDTGLSHILELRKTCVNHLVCKNMFLSTTLITRTYFTWSMFNVYTLILFAHGHTNMD